MTPRLAARRDAVCARLRSNDGFTLIELVISMALIGIVFAMYSMTMSSTITHSNRLQESAVLQGEVRAAVDAIAGDLRQTYTGTGNPGLEVMNGTTVQFLSPDRATPFRLRRIAYRLKEGKIQRAAARSTNTGNPPWTFPALGLYTNQVGSIVSTKIFTYYTADGVVTTTPADVASISVKLTVVLPQSHGREFSYATSVALRVPQ